MAYIELGPFATILVQDYETMEEMLVKSDAFNGRVNVDALTGVKFNNANLKFITQPSRYFYLGRNPQRIQRRTRNARIASIPRR